MVRIPDSYRSLKAYYYLQEAGYKPFHVKGGLAQWSRDGLPTVDADTEDEELPEGELASAGGGLGAGSASCCRRTRFPSASKVEWWSRHRASAPSGDLPEEGIGQR